MNICQSIILFNLFLYAGSIYADGTEVEMIRAEILRDRQYELLGIIRGYQEKIFAGFMLAIGWLITSNDARLYIKENRKIRRALLLSLVMLFIVTQLTLADFYVSSQQLYILLRDVESIDSETVFFHATTYRFKLSNLVISILFFSVLFLVLATLINSQKVRDEDEES